MGNAAIDVDAPREILANKLTALLSRSEIRDLSDVEALLGCGLDLESGLVDASQKDGAMSAATLAWVLSALPVGLLARREGLAETDARRLEAFRESLVGRLATLSAPP